MRGCHLFCNYLRPRRDSTYPGIHTSRSLRLLLARYRVVSDKNRLYRLLINSILPPLLSRSICRLINKIKPGSVPKINDPATMPFKKMENIANFLKATRVLGMKEFEMFSTPDLYDEKNIGQVRLCVCVEELWR